MVGDNKYYRQGVRDWKAGKKRSDCAYKHGTQEWQQWFNGWSDQSDKAFLKIVKKFPELLRDH
jgi:ribosome modulation factor